MQTTKKIRRLGGAWLFALALMCPLANRATAPLPAVHDDTYHLALPARPFPPAYESYPYGSSTNVTGGSGSYRFFISGNLPLVSAQRTQPSPSADAVYRQADPPIEKRVEDLLGPFG